MKVLQVGADPLTTTRQPHGAIFELDQARALAARGHTMELVSVSEIPRRYLARSYPYPPIALEENLVVHRHYFRFIRRGTNSCVLERTISEGIALAQTVLDAGFVPDLVHGHNLGGDLIGSAIARRLGVPLVTTEHRTAWLDPVRASRLASEWRLSLGSTARVACVGEALRHAFVRELPEMEDRVRIVPNLVDERFFLNAHPRGGVPHHTHLVMLGYLVQHKGHAEALRAFAAVYRGRAGARMTIVGDGPERRRLIRLTEDLRISDQVIWVGAQPRERVLEILRDSTALLVASTVETFSVAAIEALASGVPVVSTRCGGPEYFITENDGVLARAFDSESIAEALKEYEDRRTEFDPAAISESCRIRYSRDSVCQKIEEMWSDALSL